MRRLACCFSLATIIATAASAQTRPDETKTIGTQMPDVTLVADNDSTYLLSKLWGKPVIVSPIFTSCPHTCGIITESLRDALREVGEPGVGYEVLTVSFDPADDSASMRAYRDQMDLPPAWRLATMTEDDLSSFLAAMDFRITALEEGGFAHPNLVVVFSPDLKVSSYVHGVMYEPDALLAAMQTAAGDASLIKRFRPYLLLIMALGLVAVVGVLRVTRARKSA